MPNESMLQAVQQYQAFILTIVTLLALLACTGIGALIWMHVQTRRTNADTVQSLQTIMTALVVSTDRSASSMESVMLLLAEWLKRPVKESTQRAIYQCLRDSGRFLELDSREALVAFLAPAVAAQIRQSDQPASHLRSIVYTTATYGQEQFKTVLHNASDILNGTEAGIRFRALCAGEGFPIP